jgi:hypothetical protein
LLPGVADDHRKTAASMARVGSRVFGAITSSLCLLAPEIADRLLAGLARAGIDVCQDGRVKPVYPRGSAATAA